MSRSDFVRMAAYNALKEAGSKLPESAILPPDRAGKGGRPRKDSGVALVREEVVEYNPKKKPKPKSTDS